MNAHTLRPSCPSQRPRGLVLCDLRIRVLRLVLLAKGGAALCWESVRENTLAPLPSFHRERSSLSPSGVAGCAERVCLYMLSPGANSYKLQPRERNSCRVSVRASNCEGSSRTENVQDHK